MKSLSETLGVPHTARPDEAVPDVDIASMSAKDFALAIVTSREFRSMLMLQITCNTMPGPVMLRLFDYAYGKPVEQLEVKDTTIRPDNITPEMIAAKALGIARMAQGDNHLPEGSVH